MLCRPLISQPFLTSWAVRHDLERRDFACCISYLSLTKWLSCAFPCHITASFDERQVWTSPAALFRLTTTLPTSASVAAGSRQSGCGMVPSHITASFVDSWSCYNNKAISNTRWIFVLFYPCLFYSQQSYIINWNVYSMCALWEVIYLYNKCMCNIAHNNVVCCHGII